VVTLVSVRAYWRFLRVVRQFFPLVIAYARDRRRFLLFGGRRRVTREQQRKRAQRLLDSLLTLGPTFIKLGQLLSTRPDILPPAYIDVLARLQDDVPPAEWEEAREVLEGELGPVDERFEEFDTNPISGASLGQVYIATYRGEQVAMKVRRPGVEELVEADLQAIRWLLPVLLYFVDENRAFSMRNVADEFASTIREEMDYSREARMLQEIRANFSDDDTIRIPDTIDELSTERVLAMEYVAGTKITNVAELDRKGIDRSKLAENLQRAYMQMMVKDGVFHADPHPGNLAVTDDGRIVFYDFGMSGRVDPFIQDKIVDFYTAVASKDIDAILDTLIQMGTLSPEADRGVIAEVMEVAIQDARGQSVDQYRVQQIVSQVEDTIYEFPLRMPRDLALVLRVATVVEGVCVTLDEDFDFISVATGYLREQGYFEETVRNTVSEYGNDVRSAAGSLLRTPPKLERALDKLERNSFEVQTNLKDSNDLLTRFAKRLVYGLLVAFGGLSTTLLYVANETTATWVAGGITAVLLYLLYRALKGPKGLRASPQFTRQNLREQRSEEGGASLAPGETEVDGEESPDAPSGGPEASGPPSSGATPDGSDGRTPGGEGTGRSSGDDGATPVEERGESIPVTDRQGGIDGGRGPGENGREGRPGVDSEDPAPAAPSGGNGTGGEGGPAPGRDGRGEETQPGDGRGNGNSPDDGTPGDRRPEGGEAGETRPDDGERTATQSPGGEPDRESGDSDDAGDR
jgi:predicted unusual protein kinase regulating ubiquinone biosynthesis (AarF/ABC1/UbiB family)